MFVADSYRASALEMKYTGAIRYLIDEAFKLQDLQGKKTYSWVDTFGAPEPAPESFAPDIGKARKEFEMSQKVTQSCQSITSMLQKVAELDAAKFCGVGQFLDGLVHDALTQLSKASHCYFLKY